MVRRIRVRGEQLEQLELERLAHALLKAAREARIKRKREEERKRAIREARDDD
jgi:hypothetical protein